MPNQIYFSFSSCPANYTCLSAGDNPNYGYTNFDNFAWSLVTAFQLITMDFWENVFNYVSIDLINFYFNSFFFAFPHFSQQSTSLIWPIKLPSHQFIIKVLSRATRSFFISCLRFPSLSEQSQFVLFCRYLRLWVLGTCFISCSWYSLVRSISLIWCLPWWQSHINKKQWQCKRG